MALLAGLVALLVLVALCLGAYHVSVRDTFLILLSNVCDVTQTWPQMAYNVVCGVRLPRVVGALLVGSALAVAGGAYQGTFRNPLVSPDLLGVSSGACIGAALAILAEQGSLVIQLAAFAGGILAVAATMSVPRLLKRDSTVTLVLAGIIVGGFCGSIMGIIKYVADPETELAEITYWQMGSLAKVGWSSLTYVAPVILVAMAVLLAMRWRVNLLSLGDHEAKALGINLRFERGAVIACATLLTASAVCLAGTVGWVGLVVPHLARFVVGPNASRSLPVACVLAAGFLLVVDTLARMSGVEIPLGILTGLVGTPFFIVLLARQKGAL
jgi:iron complex transport system permease protein